MPSAIDRYSQLSKAAFDSFKVVQLKKALEAPSFQAGVVSVMKEAGIPDKYLHGISGEHVGTQDWLATFRGFADVAKDFITDKAVGLFTGAVFGPAYGGMAEAAVQNWRGSYKKAQEAKASLLKSGQWVYINNERVPGFDPGWHHELRRRLTPKAEPEDIITVGFYIAMSKRAGQVNVFNFDVFHEQQVPIEDVWPVPKAKSAELDRNPIMTRIRDLKFVKPPAPKMNTTVCTDPGSEVIFNDRLYNIVTSESGFAVIEDEFGQRYSVSLDKLKTGRKLHTNSWNYRKGKRFNTGFDSDGKARIFSGQWVWVLARPAFTGTTTHELAVVWKLQGDGIHVVQALDGVEKTVLEVWPLDDSLSETLNSEKRFVKFRLEAVEGGDTETHNLGQYNDLVLTVTGQTYQAQTKFPKKETPGETVEIEEPRQEETVGGQGGKETVDAKVEIARATGIAPGLVSTEEFVAEPIDERQNDSLFAYGAMLALGLFVYNAVDINLDVLSVF